MARSPDTAERMARIVGLRRARASWRDIAEDVGVSITRVRQLYAEALVDAPVAEVDEHRAEELVLYDDAVSELLVIARHPEVSPRTRVEAYTSIRGWCERKAKLLGLDAPTTVVTLDALDTEIARLTAELGRVAPREAAGAS
jgi:hypothetical protein